MRGGISRILVFLAILFTCVSAWGAPNLTSDDYFERMGISRFASTARITDAYLEAREQYEGDAAALSRLEQAYSVIGPEESRVHYRATLAPLPGHAQPQPGAEASVWIADRAERLIRTIHSGSSTDLEEIAYQIHTESPLLDEVDNKEVSAALVKRWKELASRASSPAEAADIMIGALWTAAKFEKVLTVDQYEEIARAVPYESLKSRWTVFTEHLRKLTYTSLQPNLIRLALLVQAHAEESDPQTKKMLEKRIAEAKQDQGNYPSGKLYGRNALVTLAREPGDARAILERATQEAHRVYSDYEYWPRLKYHLLTTSLIGSVPTACYFACAALKDSSGFIAGTAFATSALVGIAGAMFTVGPIVNYFIETSEHKDKVKQRKNAWQGLQETTATLYPELKPPEAPATGGFWSFCRNVWKAASDR